MLRRSSCVLACALALSAVGPAQSTYTNGPHITALAVGAGGADVSELIAPLTTYGYSMLLGGTNLFRLADDFTVPCGESWILSSIRVLGIVTNSATTSPVLTATWKLWNGKPGAPGSVVVHDFTSANQLVSTAFTGAYRVLNTTPLDNTRPIHEVVMNGNAITLNAGTYWLDYGVTTSANVGFFGIPIAIVGTNATGDALQGAAQTANGIFSWTGPLTSGNFAQGLVFSVDYLMSPTNCYSFALSQSVAGGALTFSNAGGNPFEIYVNALTLTPGTTSPGWFAGLDMPVTELISEILVGAPFFGVLDGAGAASFVVPAPIPTGLVLHLASVAFGTAGATAQQSAFSYTTL